MTVLKMPCQTPAISRRLLVAFSYRVTGAPDYTTNGVARFPLGCLTMPPCELS